MTGTSRLERLGFGDLEDGFFGSIGEKERPIASPIWISTMWPLPPEWTDRDENFSINRWF